jgi:GNAT superfamily N-acetyltransferase
MTAFSEAELYHRGSETLLASWDGYGRGTPNAGLHRLPGVGIAVFTDEPERGVYNNALLVRDLSPSERADAIEAMEASYRTAGVRRYAAWVHESDGAMRADLKRRGYRLDTSTLAMGVSLDDVPMSRPSLDLGEAEWAEYLRLFGMPYGLLERADRTPFRLLFACLDGEIVTTAMAFDRNGDCGIYNVETLERARRRGLGTALTAIQLHEGRQRGCQSASLQSTPMAERVYAAAGFRDLGRILEYVP